MSKSYKDNYYAGGLGLIATNPSELTQKYLREWFDGETLASAATLLGLPNSLNDSDLLVFNENQGFLNLTTEEKVLYKNTIFSYKGQKDFLQTPELIINPWKLLNITNWLNTFKIIYTQSKWISNPGSVVKLVKEIIDDIPEFDNSDTENISYKLKTQVWNKVIAVGIVNEFMNQLIRRSFKNRFLEAQAYINFKAANKDWLSRSINDQYKVRERRMGFSEYIDLYGKRADMDYELTCPRWVEIQDELKNRISSLASNPLKDVESSSFTMDNKLINASVQLQILRSEARRKTLSGIYALRLVLLKDKSVHEKMRVCYTYSPKNTINSGALIVGVSKGRAYGEIVKVDHNTVDVLPGKIGVFTSAGTDLSHLYPQFNGLIFLNGGITSHGSIIAREYGIPAIVNNNASDFENGTKIGIDGDSGLIFEAPEKSYFESDNNQNIHCDIYKDFDYQSLKVSEISKVFWFKDIKKSDSGVVGSKAARLAELKGNGLNVPYGFVISSAMAEQIEESEKVIISMIEQLEAGTVAVRSSFLGEDSYRMSFAGQFKSILNVSKSDVIAAIKEVKKSASDFEKRNEVLGIRERMSVIIQVMVESEISGVMFTQNPMRDKGQMVIEFHKGAGKVTAGNEAVNRVVVDRSTHMFKNVGEILADREIEELISIGLRIENIFKKPQDVEWALAGGKIYVLQSRPI